MSKKCVIIGGGIIGLNTAYYLLKNGHEVCIIDKGNYKSGASYVNAGYITPSHFIPLSSPGMITKGLKWMLNSDSPFFVKPRLNSDFINWAWAFKKSATQAKVDLAIPSLKDINIMSRELYKEMKESGDFDFQFDQRGLLMCYKKDETGNEEAEVAEIAAKQGMNVQHFSKDELRNLEPGVNYNVRGAFFYDTDAHMTPDDFMGQLQSYLRARGVEFISEEAVEDFEVANRKIKYVKTRDKIIKADEVILAAGSWSSKLSKKLGVKIHLEAGKGYSFNVQERLDIKIPAILTEAKVAVTPMNGFTRFAGTMELGGINELIMTNRVRKIADAAEDYYENVKIKEEDLVRARSGLRPCSPDGLPYIGKTNKVDNLYIATGHAMMGWSLGPATGKLISELVNGEKTSFKIEAFDPKRKF